MAEPVRGVIPHCYYCIGQEQPIRCINCNAWSEFYPTKEAREILPGGDKPEVKGNEQGEL